MIYTIGHSKHPAERFIELLRQHDIGALADVRSTPFSRFNPQFNRERLAAALRDAGIQYVFLGQELGARPREREFYDGDRVSYGKLARAERFPQGVERVMAGSREHRIALMCAERDPLHCHRALLISPALERAGVPVSHILADGSLETHADLMKRVKPDPQEAFPFGS
jgi:uncharacterized protein (DUF488 family)